VSTEGDLESRPAGYGALSNGKEKLSELIGPSVRQSAAKWAVAALSCRELGALGTGVVELAFGGGLVGCVRYKRRGSAVYSRTDF
jgi:hypothetical protein